MQYTLTDLIQNDGFIDWVLHPSAESDAYWRYYAASSPTRSRTVASARGYVSLLAEDTGRHTPSAGQSEQMWQVIKQNFSHDNQSFAPLQDADHPGRPVRHLVPARFSFFKRNWQIAAAIAALLAFSTATYQYYRTQTDSLLSESIARLEPFAAGPEMVTKHNVTQKPMTVLLPDGSSVVLLPGGQIGFATLDLPGNRTVTLSGRAFFEIVKDKNRPFYVFTDGIATKVLGTSFLIDAPVGTDEIKVEVKTGRVTVFRADKESAYHDRKVPEGKATIINPNQKLAFSRLSGQPITVSEQVLSSENKRPDEVARQSFTFDETPIAEVFDTLQLSYNVKINFDRALMKGCTLNANLEGEPFSKKLSVICAALSTKFEIRNDEVFIADVACK